MSSLFGVVVRAYNMEDYIKRAVESIISQTFSDWKAVIVDDGSEDNTNMLSRQLAERDERISVIRVDREGCVLATLEGVKSLDCKYIASLDADDWFDESYLEEAADLIGRYDVDIINNGMTLYFDNGEIRKQGSKKENTILNRDDFLDYVLESTAHGVSIKIIKKSLFQFDEESMIFFKKEKTNLNYNDDTCLIVPIICNAKKCLISNKCLYQYYIRENSNSREWKPWKQIRCTFMAMEYVDHFLGKRNMHNDKRREYIMRECIRQLLPRVTYITKKFYKRWPNRFRLRTMGYYHELLKHDYFRCALEKYGRKRAFALRVFLALNK